MGRSKQPYTILPPESKGGSYRYRLGSDLKRKKKSTGKKTHREAILFCEALLKADSRGDQLFRFYAKDFYIDGKCPYQAIKRRAGKQIDKETLKDERSRLEGYLLPAFGDIMLKDLSVQHWDHWLGEIEAGKILTKGLSPHKPADGTINRIRRCLIQVLDVAVRHGIITTNVARLTESMSQSSYKRRDPLSDEEINILFPEGEKELLKIWGSYDRVALFSLLLHSGIRSGEVQALKWSKVDFALGGVIIDKAIQYDGKIGSPKGKIPRAFVIPKKTMLILKKWKSITLKNGENDFVFYQANSKDQIRGDTILTVFRRVLKTNKINPNKNLNVHSLRHTFTTRLAEQLPIEAVMAFTGHKSIKMVERYTHPDMQKELANIKCKYGKEINTIWNVKKTGGQNRKTTKTEQDVSDSQ